MTAHPHTPWPRLVVVALALAAAVSVLLIAFLWPTVTSSVSSLPIAVVAPSPQADAVEQALEERSPGTFAVTTAATRDEAVDLIESRAVYGALVLGPQPEVLTASAASPPVAQLLSALAPALQAQATAAAQAQGDRAAGPDHGDGHRRRSARRRRSAGCGHRRVLVPRRSRGHARGHHRLDRGRRRLAPRRRGARLLRRRRRRARRHPAGLVRRAAGRCTGERRGDVAGPALDQLRDRRSRVDHRSARASPSGRSSSCSSPTRSRPRRSPSSSSRSRGARSASGFRRAPRRPSCASSRYFPAANTLFPWLVLAAWAAGGLLLQPRRALPLLRRGVIGGPRGGGRVAPQGRSSA